MPMEKKFIPGRITLVFVVAGAIGNFIDRVSQGFVVDFLYFKLIDFPVFNVADIYVVVGVTLLALMILFVVKDEDLDFKKKKDE
jgi:signal peptidase II